MERCDGKTKKDDYLKYGGIALAAVLVVAGLCLLTSRLKAGSRTEPDFQVVVGAETPFNQSVQEDLETVLESVAEDRNGDGVVTVQVEYLRLVDFQTRSVGDENTAVSGDEAFQQMQLYLTDQDIDLFLLSDEPSGSFRGAATVYVQGEYFQELPSDLADAAYPSRADLSAAPFWQELGLEDVPFYGCVLDGGDHDDAIEVLRQLKTAHVTLW
jgi:hypothetical protein